MNNKLQSLCRKYLERVRLIARSHGLESWVDETIKENLEGRCVATEENVEMLSRIVNDERLTRVNVAKELGKSYRQCNDDGTFDKIKKLPYVGIYSKVSALLHKD